MGWSKIHVLMTVKRDAPTIRTRQTSPSPISPSVLEKIMPTGSDNDGPLARFSGLTGRVSLA